MRGDREGAGSVVLKKSVEGREEAGSGDRKVRRAGGRPTQVVQKWLLRYRPRAPGKLRLRSVRIARRTEPEGPAPAIQTSEAPGLAGPPALGKPGLAGPRNDRWAHARGREPTAALAKLRRRPGKQPARRASRLGANVVRAPQTGGSRAPPQAAGRPQQPRTRDGW